MLHATPISIHDAKAAIVRYQNRTMPDRVFRVDECKRRETGAVRCSVILPAKVTGGGLPPEDIEFFYRVQARRRADGSISVSALS